jgi:hypothetical protein
MDKETMKGIGYLTAGCGILLTSFAVLKNSSILSGVGNNLLLKWVSIIELTITLFCLTAFLVIGLINTVTNMKYDLNKKIDELSRLINNVATNTGPEILSIVASILMYFIEDLILPDDTSKLEKVVLCSIFGILFWLSSTLISNKKIAIKAVGLFVYIFPIPFSLYIYHIDIFEYFRKITAKNILLVVAEIVALLLLVTLSLVRKKGDT